MARHCVDYRDFPNQAGCDLTICSDNEEHLIDAAVVHAQTVHGETDTPQLREEIRKSLKLENILSHAA